MVDGALDVVEDGLELGFEELPELVASLDACAEGALTQVFKDDGGSGGADVGFEEDGFEMIEGGGVNLAGERDDGGDGFAEGFAGAGDRLLSCGRRGHAWAGVAQLPLQERNRVRVYRVCKEVESHAVASFSGDGGGRLVLLMYCAGGH